MGWTVFRDQISSYFGNNLVQQEKAMAEELGFKYYFQTAPERSPDIFLSNTHTNFKKLADQDFFSNTKFIIHANSGYDNFPFDFVKDFSGSIILGNQIRQHAVADYIMASLYRWLTPLSKSSKWDQQRSFKRKVASNCQVLLLGKGHIGTIVSNALINLGMTVHISDPHLGFNANPDLSCIDIIILCAGLNPTSRHIIDQRFFKKLKSEFLLINSARGPLINHSDLKNAIRNSPEAQFVLDVFETEPYALEEFIECPNVIVTSHIAGVHDMLGHDTLEFIYKALKDIVSALNQDQSTLPAGKFPLLRDRLMPNYLL